MPIPCDIKIECPYCGKKGQFVEDEKEDIYCTYCGLIIQTNYPYVAGFKIKTLTEFLLETEEKGEVKK